MRSLHLDDVILLDGVTFSRSESWKMLRSNHLDGGFAVDIISDEALSTGYRSDREAGAC